MEHQIKQRVVGAVVLLALAVIFLPLLLDGDGNYQPAISSRIPETPIVDVMPEPIPQRPQIAADQFASEPEQQATITVLTDGEPEDSGATLESPAAVAAPPENATDNLAAAEPALDERSLPEGWSVRLGVFSNAQNASNLTRRLLDSGYRAYTRELPGAQGPVTGVFVGPQVERAQANRLKTELQGEFQLSGLVVRFEVDAL